MSAKRLKRGSMSAGRLKHGRGRRYATWVSLAVFAGLLIAGLCFDEFGTVLANAITICLSCIGIG
ncbi:MAG: hypothetical protein JW990_12960 [Thermoleophilia bacterium]|nr:hypothetical protein [Thermoleophilia bacterium]